MSKKRDPQGVRAHNRRVVLEAVKGAGTTSRIDLARRTGLSPATAGFIVTDLMEQRLTREGAKQQAKAGRKATTVELDRSHWRFVCIDLWHRVVHATAMNLASEVVAVEEQPLKSRLLPAQIMRCIGKMIERLMARAGGELAALGVSVDGTVHPWTGAVTSWMWLRGTQFEIRRCMKERYRVPVIVENVDRIKAWAEFARNHDGPQNIVCFSISTGIGAGVVARGEIYRGAAAAGDIAHIRIAETGPRCTLGHRGCLEGLVSEKTILSELGTFAGRAVHVAEIDKLCKTNSKADQLIREKAAILGTALAYVVCSLHPGLLMLTGPVFEESDVFFKTVCREIAKRSPLKKWRWPKIRRSSFGDEQMRIGMADLLWRVFCESDFLDVR